MDSEPERIQSLQNYIDDSLDRRDMNRQSAMANRLDHVLDYSTRGDAELIRLNAAENAAQAANRYLPSGTGARQPVNQDPGRRGWDHRNRPNGPSGSRSGRRG